MMDISFRNTQQDTMVLEKISTMQPPPILSPAWTSIDKSENVLLKHCSVIGPTDVEGMTACPCCNRQLRRGRQTVGVTSLASPRDGTLFVDDKSDSDSGEDMDEVDDATMMPGLLSYGTAYTVTQNLVQGWVHKKGTGMDWLRSRAWKPRWAVLSVSQSFEMIGVVF